MRFPLEIPLRRSRRIRFLLAAAHLTAASAILFSSLDPLVRLLLALVLVWSWAKGLARERAKSQLTLVLRDDGVLSCRCGGQQSEARVAAGVVDFGAAVWLRLLAVDATRPLPPMARSLMLMPDSLPGMSWRPLRIWLRHKAASTALNDSGAA